MPYGILGPTLPAVGGARLRATLARLLLDAGTVVPLPRLIDDLYGDTPPAGALNALQSNVSRLRRELPITYDGSGYRLDVAPGEVDAHRFARLLTEARDALRAGDPVAGELFAGALALWRGEALADVRPAPFAAAAADRLAELRRQAVEGRIEAELRTRPSAGAVDELRALLDAEPLREHAWALLMRSLVAGGRPAEALTAYESVRRLLAEELGADPSAELVALHASILRDTAAGPAARHRLPAQLTSFVGRSEEVALAERALRTGRLVTLLGPGGAGKTRLALEVAARHPGAEVCLAELAGSGPDGVPRAVFDALGLRDTGLRDRRGDGPDTVERLLAALSTRDLLLVLDNCEHVVAAAAALTGRLLARCPGLRVLATSREPLGVTGEVRLPVPGLPSEAAVRLFADRAALVAPGFTLDAATEPAVRSIVRTLDGLPLAVELAAARLPVLPVDELARRVGDRFRLLSRGSSTAAARHRTLRAVVAWSWELLTPSERLLASRFTVFRGGAALDAVEQVCGLGDATLDVLDGLVAKSLIERDGSRYRMLATIRDFCGEQLTEDLTAAHAAHYLRLAQTADAQLRGPAQLEWLDRLDADRDNLHAAVRQGPVETGLRLVAALSFYWWLHGVRGEASALAREVLDRAGPVAPAGLAEEHVLCALNAGLSGPPAGEHPARYVAGLSAPPAQPFLLYLSAIAAGPPEGLHDQLLELQEALRVRLGGSPWGQALASIGSGWLAVFRGRHDRAAAEFARALAGFRALGERWGTMLAQSGIAELATLTGDYAAARAGTDEALRLAAELRSPVDLADLLRSRGEARMLGDDPAGAGADLERAVALAAECGAPELVAAARLGQGRLALRSGDPARARELCLQALSECPTGWYTAEGTRLSILLTLGRVAQALGDPAEAARWYEQVTPGVPGPDGENAVAEAAAALDGLALRRTGG
ncbi:ATP-binding protein [Actinoplanes sp. URMC 104]|uniref:ATP-binding protein n=1 Tax=Actinoplanes sp. URMC 104 TaxID=3423409 RepID=UPI003F198817